MNFTYISTDNTKINMAFHIALSDLYGNIKPFKDGLLKEEKPVIIEVWAIVNHGRVMRP